jgi:hypothetical protein
MAAPAGIHDFSVGVTKALDPGATKKSWMPACAGMTSFFGCAVEAKRLKE